MELVFIGADHEVTGSCHYLRVGDQNLLIDCGMEQGKDLFENAPLPVKPERIQMVILTHAHIDHTGMLPKLYADGFRGRILCTKATKELSDIMLRDSAHIQLQETEYKNQKAKKRGDAMAQPLYTMEDTLNVLRLMEACPYDEILEPCKGVRVRFTDIGHLLGSASIELWLTERGHEKKIVFSGDIGNTDQPLLRDPKTTKEADFVVMESTYGDRLHDQSEKNHIRQLADVIEKTLGKGGNVVIPAFAVGRTQVLLYFIRQIKEEGLVSDVNFPVYVDSPMAVSATNIFENNEITCYDEEAQKLLDLGVNPLSFPNLHLSITTEESIAIGEDAAPKVIISASGMCDAGRIRHHIKHNIENPASTILFVGYQAQGTLGRRLLDGVLSVKLFGKEYVVRAGIARMDGMSGHADKEGLLNWINAFEKKPRQVFVVHGEDPAASSFARCLEEEYDLKAMAPYSGTRYDLVAERFIKIAKPVPVSSKGKEEVQPLSDDYAKLKAAAKRFNAMVEASGGLPNKELQAMTRQINEICRKYEL